QILPTASLAEIMKILADVAMHEQCLATAGRHPKSDLVQLARYEWLHLIARIQLLVRCIDRTVQRYKKRAGVLEIPVEIHLGEQQPEILKIERVQCLAEQIALAGNMLPVRDDIAVVVPELLVGN